MTAMFNLWRDVYRTYRGDGEHHIFRLCACAGIAISIAYLSERISDSALQMMAVAVSVLTGFTFTALFSSYSATAADLPEPRDETDRRDLNRISVLEKNFQARSKFLILASMVSLTAMVLLSIEIHPMPLVWTIASTLSIGQVKFQGIYHYATLAWQIMTFVTKGAVIFVFLEAIYTFYRLSETVVSALTIKGAYKEAHRE